MSNPKVAKKGKKYIPVRDLDPEQLAARRADELRRKQGQRAKKAGKTLDQYRENIVKKDTVRRERREAGLWEREIQANERNIRRQMYERQDNIDDVRDNKRWGKSLWGKKSGRKDFLLPGIGTKLKKIRKKLRRQLRDIYEKRKWTDPRKPLPLETKRVYDMFNRLHRWHIDGSNYKDPEVFLEVCWKSVARAIDSVKGTKKTYFKLEVLLSKLDMKTGKETFDNSAFSSGMYDMIRTSDDLEEYWSEIMTTLLTRLSKFQENGSGWVLKRINKLIVSADVYDPIAGSSFLKLPEFIRKRKAVINITNEDDSCFPLAVAAAQLRNEDPNVKNLERPTNKKLQKKMGELNMKGIQTPVILKDIDKFENQNPGINVMVFGLTDTKKTSDGDRKVNISHLRIKRRPDKSRETVRLLMWGNETTGNFHYSPITSLSRLLSKQVSDHDGEKFFCDNCGNKFSSERVLKNHEEMCYTNECQRTVYVNKILQFDKWISSQRVPFAVYSDIESYNIGCDDSGKNTIKLSEQTPSGLAYLIVGPEGFEPTYKKFNNTTEYMKSLLGDLNKIYWRWFHKDKPLEMTEEDTKRHNNASKCYVCETSFTKPTKKYLGNAKEAEKVKNRDHDHFTGKYRGAACSRCNLAMRKPRFVPVFFHNLEGYDGHLIIEEVAKYGRLTCIPHTKEKYTSFSLKLIEGFGADSGFEVRFLDSFKFLGKGLGKMVKTLTDSDFVLSRKMFPSITEEQMGLLRKKGVYPYSWVDEPDKMRKRKLPPIEAFYNDLNETDCTKKDYEHAKNVWRAFGMKTFQKYHDTYLKSDIVQLADVFENFRSMAHKTYGLDPAWDFTRSGFAWKSMFKITKAKLETLGDPDMYLFFERAMRGGISFIAKRHTVANHKYLEEYDAERESVFIIDNDMNNLYGGPESDLLPTGNFRWMDEKELPNWNKFPDHTGCFVEIDLEYPRKLHDLHNDYPFACEKMVVGKTTKLVPNLNDKEKYVIHYKELEQCVKHGLRIKKIHRGIKFDQSRWMKPFIDLNTKLRTESTSEFGKDFFKGMNLSVYSKTGENVRKWKDIKLISSGEKNPEKRSNKYISRPNYKGANRFSDSLTALEMTKPTAVMEKPIYVGATILSGSKVMMSEFWYDYAKPKWGENVSLLFTDTDSMCIEVRTKDYYKDISPDVERWFDTSNYPKSHPSGIPSGINKKVIGKMKDECGGENILRYSGQKPKSYAILKESDDEIKRLKGVKQYVVGRMTYWEFEDCTLNGTTTYASQNTIRSRDHKIFVERMTKKALCPDDNKRYVLPNGINTLALGHWKIPE